VFKVWPEGVARMKSILDADLSRGIELAAWQGGAAGMVTGTANVLYDLVFRFTGVHDMVLRFAEGAALSIPDTIVRNFYVANREAIEVAMMGTQLLGVRLATLAMIGPILSMVYIVAATDGLTQRAIRRACGGRESGSLYHRAKHLQVALIVMAVLTGLLWPLVTEIRWIGMPLTAALGVLSRLQWAYYKKHL
jgi:integrating conjugative element membrane protein (TIGR03747 family)